MMQPRPLSPRKTVQLMVILTILAWATQTLLAQWGYGQAIQRAVVNVPATVEIRCEATIDGGDVTLKQLCRWNDSAGVDAHAGLVIATLSKDNPVRQIGMNEIKAALQTAGVNLTEVQFAGAASCAVRRSEVDDETFARFLAKDAPDVREVPAAPVETAEVVVPPVERVEIPEIEAAVAEVAATKPALRKQLVLTRPLSAGQKLLAGDVAVQVLIDSGDEFAAEVSPEEVIGALLIKDMKRGEVITAASVRPAPIVLKDQFITIAMSFNGQVVETVARALEDGIRGQIIQARNEATRQVYHVTVTAEAAAEVNSSTGVASTSDQIKE